MGVNSHLRKSYPENPDSDKPFTPGFRRRPLLTMLLGMVGSLRIRAVSAGLFGLPVADSH